MRNASELLRKLCTRKGWSWTSKTGGRSGDNLNQISKKTCQRIWTLQKSARRITEWFYWVPLNLPLLGVPTSNTTLKGGCDLMFTLFGKMTRWWFHFFNYFHPYLGKIPNLTNIFQMGCNHQLDDHRLFCCFWLLISEKRRNQVISLRLTWVFRIDWHEFPLK